jgi:glycerol-3-phosphate acyltransferase PlsY
VLALLGLTGAFLLGSVPFGLLLGWLWQRRDVRTSGSGNIGATNVLRTVGKTAGLATLLLDLLKGAGGVVLARWLGPEPVPGDLLAPGSLYLNAALVLPVIGHCYSPWLGFRGGKGVATSLGVLLVAWWPGALIGLAVFTLVVGFSRLVSLGSLAAAFLLPLAILVSTWARIRFLPAGLVLGLVVIARHRANLSRLLAGTESRIGPFTDRRSGRR